MSKLDEAREWLRKSIKAAYIDIGVNHDYEEWAHVCELAIDRRCATCRWAVAKGWFDDITLNPRITLSCNRLHSADREALAHAGVNVERGGDPGILVAPDFGCVQWQAKDDPASEAP